jgi:hypothetical protein
MKLRLQLRHAEPVSASMADALVGRLGWEEGGPWTLKQVQGDEKDHPPPCANGNYAVAWMMIIVELCTS